MNAFHCPRNFANVLRFALVPLISCLFVACNSDNSTPAQPVQPAALSASPLGYTPYGDYVYNEEFEEAASPSPSNQATLTLHVRLPIPLTSLSDCQNKLQSNDPVKMASAIRTYAVDPYKKKWDVRYPHVKNTLAKVAAEYVPNQPLPPWKPRAYYDASINPNESGAWIEFVYAIQLEATVDINAVNNYFKVPTHQDLGGKGELQKSIADPAARYELDLGP